MNWQPIETAPRDGTRVLLYRPEASLWWQVMGGRFDGDKYAKKPRPFWASDNWSLTKTEQRSCDPTHWMPLQPPPSGEG